MQKEFDLSKKNRLREKGKLIYTNCPDPENWTCVLSFVDKHRKENPVIIDDFMEFLKEEIRELEVENQQPRLDQTKNLLRIVKDKLSKKQ